MMDNELEVDQPTGEEPSLSIEDEMLGIVQKIEADEKGTVAPEVEPGAFDRARDESGRFKPADKAAEAKPVADAQPVAPADPKAPAQPGQFVDRGAPNTWRPGAKALWNGVSPEIKAEIYKREQDTATGIQQYSSKAQIADHLMATIQPYRPIMDALGSDIPNALNEVLKTAAIFHVGTPEQKAATLRTLAQRHGVDLNVAVNNGQNDQFRDPIVERLESRLAATEGRLAQYERGAQNSVFEVAHGEINAFQNDPANKYFIDVAADMGRLMTAGLASTMKEAYDKACQLNPAVKAAVEQERFAASSADRAKTAAAARRAGDLSVRSAPTPRPVQNPHKSWQDSMEDTFAEIVGRNAA